jgi:hypothetical protein
MESTKNNPRYKGLTSYKKPSDATTDEPARKVTVSLYPLAINQLEGLRTMVGMEGRSQLVRAALAFADNHQSEFVEFLAATNSEVKAG